MHLVVLALRVAIFYPASDTCNTQTLVPVRSKRTSQNPSIISHPLKSQLATYFIYSLQHTITIKIISILNPKVGLYSVASLRVHLVLLQELLLVFIKLFCFQYEKMCYAVQLVGGVQGYVYHSHVAPILVQLANRRQCLTGSAQRVCVCILFFSSVKRYSSGVFVPMPHTTCLVSIIANLTPQKPIRCPATRSPPC